MKAEDQRVNKIEAAEALKKITEEFNALHEEAFQRSANDTFSISFGEKIEKNLARLTSQLGEARKAFVPAIEVAASLLNGRLLSASDYKKFMPNLMNEIAPQASLPFDIVDILESQSPLHEKGVLVKDSHLLAWIPNNITLRALGNALGGSKGKIFNSDDFMWWPNNRVDITLGACGRSSYWALIPDKLPPGTELNDFNSSIAVLNEKYPQYQQADVVSYSSALLLHGIKNGERWYPHSMGWCADPRIGTIFDDASCHGGDRLSALVIGDFGSVGLVVNTLNPNHVLSSIGCAVSWNFGT